MRCTRSRRLCVYGWKIIRGGPVIAIRSAKELSLLVELAKSEPALIHVTDGTEFVIEEADQFEREVAALGASDKFMAFLKNRSQGEKEIPASDVPKRLAINSEAT